MTNFVDIQNEVLAHRLNDAKYREPVKNWINEGQRFIYLQTDLRGGEDAQDYTTVAGTPSLALPSDFLRTVSLFESADHIPIYFMDLRAYDDAPEASGKPTSYTISGSTALLYPTPDAAYAIELRYYRLPVDLSVDSDEPELPEQYRHLLVRYALIRAFERENDYDAANYYREQFDVELTRLRGQVQYDTHDGPTQVPGLYEENTVDANLWY